MKELHGLVSVRELGGWKLGGIAVRPEAEGKIGDELVAGSGFPAWKSLWNYCSLFSKASPHV